MWRPKYSFLKSEVLFLLIIITAVAAAAGLICNVQIKKKKKGSSEEKETCCMLSVKTAAEVQGKEQATADSQSRCDMKGFGVRGEKG